MVTHKLLQRCTEEVCYLLPESICSDFEHLLDAPEENNIVAIDLEKEKNIRYWKILFILFYLIVRAEDTTFNR